MPFRIDYLPTVVADDIPSLPHNMRARIKGAIERKLGAEPAVFGKPLRYSWRGHLRLRVGDWRIVYRIDSDAVVVTIVKIMHRKDVYDD